MMSKKIVKTDQAPAAIGPYSQGVIANGLIYTAGQVPIDPQTGEIVEGGIEAQTRQSLENIKAILEAAGTNLSHVIKTTVFLQSMDDFAKMNAVYADYLGEQSPARSTVQVARLPLNVLVEIDVIALVEA